MKGLVANLSRGEVSKPLLFQTRFLPLDFWLCDHRFMISISFGPANRGKQYCKTQRKNIPGQLPRGNQCPSRICNNSL